MVRKRVAFICYGSLDITGEVDMYVARHGRSGVGRIRGEQNGRKTS